MRSKCNEPCFKLPYYFAEPLSANVTVTSLRTTTLADLENLLNTMESILSHSEVLLRSASVLSRSVIRCQAPAEIIRLETDDALLDTDTEYSRQDLDALLEPCNVVTPLGKYHGGTTQAEGKDGYGWEED